MRNVITERDVTINDVVKWETLPVHYARIAPFSATIHHAGLGMRERSLIEDALVNAAHEIRRLRDEGNVDAFRWEYESE